MRLVSVALHPDTVISTELKSPVKNLRIAPKISNRPLNRFSQARDMVVLVVKVTRKLAAGSGVAERDIENERERWQIKWRACEKERPLCIQCFQL